MKLIKYIIIILLFAFPAWGNHFEAGGSNSIETGSNSIEAYKTIKVVTAAFGWPSDATAQTACGFSDVMRISRLGKMDEIKSWCPNVITVLYEHSMRITYTDNSGDKWYARWNTIENDEDLFHHTLGTSAGYGTHTPAGSSATVLTDTGQSWATDTWVDSRIFNTTDGSNCVVTSNDGTTITCSGGLENGTDNTWKQNDVYNVDRHHGSSSVYVYGDESNTDWADQLVTWSEALTADVDKIYYDVCRPRWPTWESAAPSGYVAADFETDKKTQIDSMGTGIDRPVIINSLGPIFELCTETTPADWFDNVEGAQAENFMFTKASSTFTKADIETDMENIIFLRDNDKTADAIGRPSASDTTTRMTMVSGYLMVMYDDSYFGMADGATEENTFTWYPEFLIDIGRPTEEFDDIDDAITQTYFWVRNYDSGIAVINFDGSNRDFTFTGTYEKAVVSGGGEIEENGDLPTGSLTWTSVSSPLTITAETGMILRTR